MINFADAAHAAPAPPDQMLAVRLSDQVFAADGYLVNALGLEHRPQQEAMAQAVVRNFTSERALLFEAGTGVGKSLAYLVPGILRAMLCERPCVVSTHTIALQQQLLNNDLPKCQALFAAVPELERFAGFKAALMLGRGNYLCGHRLARAIATRTDLFGGPQEEELERIAQWAALTEEGIREELSPAPDPEVWDWVNSDASSCNSRNCTPETCFYRRALEKRKAAQVIVVNHSLLFSLMQAMGGGGDGGEAGGASRRGVLLPNDFVVLDEAHTVPDIATDHFGLSISSYGLIRALRQLYNPRGGKKPRGLLVKCGFKEDHQAVVQAIAAAEFFFNDLNLRYLSKVDKLRLLEDCWAEPTLNRPLGHVIDRLGALKQRFSSDRPLGEELTEHRRRLQGYQQGLNEALELKYHPAHVYWLETSGRGRTNTAVRSAPLDVSKDLRTCLFERGSAVLMASATLTTGSDNCNTFASRVGASGEDSAVEHSPFDYEKNLSVFIATDMPEPGSGGNGGSVSGGSSGNSGGGSNRASSGGDSAANRARGAGAGSTPDAVRGEVSGRPQNPAAGTGGDARGSGRSGDRRLSYLADVIDFAARRARERFDGGTLALFTSYQDLRYVADALAAQYAKEGRTLLAQGQGLSRRELKDRFVEDGSALLLGTESFWTGFDVPGAALSQVIITRLPFDVPTEPVRQARAEWISERGGNPFAQMTLPEALVRFRQGIGRLLRCQSDCGWLTLLDARITTRPYGQQFLQAIPKGEHHRFNARNRDSVFAQG